RGRGNGGFRSGPAGDRERGWRLGPLSVADNERRFLFLSPSGVAGSGNTAAGLTGFANSRQVASRRLLRPQSASGGRGDDTRQRSSGRRQRECSSRSDPVDQPPSQGRPERDP